MMGISAIFRSTGKRLAVCGSGLFCLIALLLPYRLREFFVFIMHFALNGILVKLKLFAGWISAALGFLFFLPVYYLGIPLTLALRKLFSSGRAGFEKVDRVVDDNGNYRMF